MYVVVKNTQLGGWLGWFFGDARKHEIHAIVNLHVKNNDGIMLAVSDLEKVKDFGINASDVQMMNVG